MRAGIASAILVLVALYSRAAVAAAPSWCDHVVAGKCEACTFKVRFSSSAGMSGMCPNMPSGTKQIQLRVPVAVDAAAGPLFGVHYALSVTRGTQPPVRFAPPPVTDKQNRLILQLTDTLEDNEGGDIKLRLIADPGFSHSIPKGDQQYSKVSTLDNDENSFVAIRLVTLGPPPKPPGPTVTTEPATKTPAESRAPTPTAPPASESKRRTFVQAVYTAVKENWQILTGMASLLGGLGLWTAVRRRWQRHHTQPIAKNLRSLTFGADGLLKPVDNIATRKGTQTDCDDIAGKLQATNEIDNIISELMSHRPRISDHFGERVAGTLDDQVGLVKGKIRDDLLRLSRMKPQAPEAITLATQIQKQIGAFNKEIRRFHDKIFPPRSKGTD